MAYGSCGITLYCDRRHKKLETPIHFDSHKAAAAWLNRSYTFVYQMVKLGEAVEDVHSFRHITPYAQNCGRQSSLWSSMHYNECVCDPDHVQQCLNIQRTKQVKMTKSDGSVMYFNSAQDCDVYLGWCGACAAYHCRTQKPLGQNSKYAGYKFEYV